VVLVTSCIVFFSKKRKLSFPACVLKMQTPLQQIEAKQAEAKITIDVLPVELIGEIFSYLPLYMHATLPVVCKAWKSVVDYGLNYPERIHLTSEFNCFKWLARTTCRHQIVISECVSDVSLDGFSQEVAKRKGTPRIEKLTLYQTTLTNPSLEQFDSLFPYLTELTLALSPTLTSVSSKAIQALCTLPLTSLSLYSARLDTGAFALLGTTHLKSLDLSGSISAPISGPISGKQMSALLQPCLTSLTLMGFTLTVEACRRLGQSTLKELCLDQKIDFPALLQKHDWTELSLNTLTFEEIKLLAPCKELTYLSTTLADYAGEGIGQILSHLPVLSGLNLEGVSLTALDVVHLASVESLTFQWDDEFSNLVPLVSVFGDLNITLSAVPSPYDLLRLRNTAMFQLVLSIWIDDDGLVDLVNWHSVKDVLLTSLSYVEINFPNQDLYF